MNLTEATYYGAEANRSYFSVSQFKDFLKCPAMAMAKIRGEYVPEKSRALLLGSFVDEMLTGDEKSKTAFMIENRDELFKKNGDPYADVAQAMETVERVRNQPLMMHYLSGEHQVIMTGEIEGVPVKGKFDSYKPRKFLVDLKYLKSLRSPNLFENVLDYWKYPMQMAVYQELVYQNTGERLPCYIVAATKESPAHITVCEIDQYTLDEELEVVKANIPHFQKIKNGEIEPERCESYDCDFCTVTKMLTEPIPYEQIGMSTAQLKAMRGEI
jgi:hypothetical protein